MAAGAPIWTTVGNWVSQQVSAVYNYVSNNVSGAPLGIFSALADTAPYSMPGVKFSTHNDLPSDVRALLSGSEWNKSVVTYSFPDSRWDYQLINPSASGYRTAQFGTEQAVRYALEGYSPYAGGPKMGMTSVESFTNLSLEYAGRNDATLQISGFNPGSVINRSHAYYPGVPFYSGDVWLHYDVTATGTYNAYLALHELGHSLGLKHSHESGGSLPTMSAEHDSVEYTVMSYKTFSDSPQTFMQYDVAALQAMYGADFTTNSGNTVYNWSPTTGEAFVNGVGQGAPARNYIFMTVWDGGGNDTYDVSNYHGATSIDLAPGGYVKFSQEQLAYRGSSVYAHGNVYNAFQFHDDPRSLIENAVGGTGNDDIRGNAADNVLTGNAGDDTLSGGTGNDRLLGGDGVDLISGGAGADTLDGGAGTYDTIGYSDSAVGVNVNIGTNTASGGIANGDRISGFENIIGSFGNDVLYGSAGDNAIFGGSGGDQIVGSGGNDWLTGEDGDDMLIVTDGGSATMTGGAGDDRFVVFPGTKAKILDFAAGAGTPDEIMIYKNIFASFAEVSAAAVQNGNNVSITKGDFGIELVNVQLAKLQANDFIFMNI
ncbi:M10 family metallopeptidase [Microvirga antarctica]|uniref:M10 family metallopeptidase n=1 Tax=Microvirga antarctica TaxID=2819233 RepID=UPI001B3160AD|nr:M10 family metallopeptidase [Microvirga antarctica]